MSDETIHDTMETQPLLSSFVMKKGRKPKLVADESIKKSKKEKQSSYERLSAEEAVAAPPLPTEGLTVHDTMETQPLPVTKKGRKPKLVADELIKKEKEAVAAALPLTEVKQWLTVSNVMKMVLSLSEGRSIRVTRSLIVLEDEVQAKFVSFNFQKLSKIMQAVHAVDEAIEKMKNYEDSNLRIDIGGNWYLTMTTGVKCVDIRRWFHVGDNYRPSKNGMALRLGEWQLFKQRVKTIHQLRPDIAVVIPCYHQQDHNDQLGEFIKCNFKYKYY
jgi:hypothetical protein